MPVSFEEIKKNIGNGIVSMVCDHIDKHLSDVMWVKTWVHNAESNPTFTFIYPGTASNGDKSAIIEAYKGAGWGTVAIRNSSENGERGNLINVILQRDAQ